MSVDQAGYLFRGLLHFASMCYNRLTRKDSDEMLFLLRVFDDSEVFEYEYGNLRHALELALYESLPWRISIVDTKSNQESLICTSESKKN